MRFRWSLLAPMVLLACYRSGPRASDEGGSSSSTAAAATTSVVGVDDEGTGSSPTGGTAETGGEPTGPIGVLTITLATAIEDEPAVDASKLELCLTQSDCFPLVRPQRAGLGKREAGPIAFDVHAFDDVPLTFESVDRYELRTTSAVEFQPRCLSVSLGGRPTFCTKDFSSSLGEGTSFTSQTPSDCTSCFERGADEDLRVTHGPFVGERHAVARRARIWLRTDAARKVELFVSEHPDMSGERLAAVATPRPEDDFTTRLVVEDLDPGVVYHYRLVVDGLPHVPQEGDEWHPGGIYRLAMPPAAGQAGKFSFAFGSCARMFAHGNYRAVRDRKPEFLLSVGDYHYGDVLQYHFLDEAGSRDWRIARDDMRWWYRTAHWEKSSLLATVPFYNTWDDHDYGGGQTYADREAEARDASRSVFLEYFANPVRPEHPEDEAVYFRFTHGDIEVFVLDARWHRPRLCAFEGGGTACDPQEDPLGPTQTDWLIEGLSSSTATFKLVAAGTRFYGGGNKAWTPFLIARDAMLKRIVDAGVSGVVFLAGGPHVSEYRRFEAAGRVWHELGSSPLSSGLGSCSGAANQIECFDAIKNFLQVDVDTTIADPTLVARIMTFNGEHPWSATTQAVVIRRSVLN